MKARVSSLYKTEAEWNAINFIPLPGEIVIYAPDDAKYTYARVKVGDGITPLHQLPFCLEACVDTKIQEYQQAAISDAGEISSYFK